MEFKIKVDEIGSLDVSDDDKVKLVKEYIVSRYRSENSWPVKASHAKKRLLSKGKIGEEAAKKIKFQGISEKLRKEQDEKLKNIETIVIIKKTFDKLLSYKESNGIELFIYLLLTSGLRFGELFNGKFEIRDKKLFVNKLSKKRGEDKNKEYEVRLILIKPREFLKLLNKFRASNTIKKGSANNRSNEKLNELGLTSHSMRGIYLFYQLNINKVEGNKSAHEATRKILNHEGYGTGAFYNNKYKVKGLSKDLSGMTVKELKAEAKSNGLKGYSTMKKQELLEVLGKIHSV